VLQHFAYTAALVFATTFIHAGCTAGVLGWLHSLTSHHWALRSAVGRATVLGGVVLLMSIASYLESALWGLFYWKAGAVTTLGDGLYFSLVTFTTLGYGDITLPEQWRMLGAFEAANGVIMFGWTTALIVAIVQRMYVRHSPVETAD
jgi:voltage-gated potassium channel Kch